MGMPRLLEAKKDVVSCEKLRGFANETRSADIRMGTTRQVEDLSHREVS